MSPGNFPSPGTFPMRDTHKPTPMRIKPKKMRVFAKSFTVHDDNIAYLQVATSFKVGGFFREVRGNGREACG